MLTHIPTHVIGGPLGAGKTSLIRQLLAQKPAAERWAVLINEFGQIGLDAALLSTDQEGIGLAEIAGGCLCCLNGVPFQVGLSRLLRQVRPQRLFIEPSGLGHPQQLLQQLRQPPWVGVLALQPLVLVLDAQALARGEPLPVSVQSALAEAGLLLLNKAEAVAPATRGLIQARLPAVPLQWICDGQLPLSQLPGSPLSTAPQTATLASLPPAGPALPPLWRTVDQPICQVQAQAEGWSIGWRWHPDQRFDPQRVQAWLQTLDWRRAKLVIHSPEGWCSANVLGGEPWSWRASEWRQDSRLELIFAAPQAVEPLQAAIQTCLLAGGEG